MSAYSSFTLNKLTYDGKANPSSNWNNQIALKANKNECLDLAMRLASGSVGTEYYQRAHIIALTWAKEIINKKEAGTVNLKQEFCHSMNRHYSNAGNLNSLSKEMVAFVDEMFAVNSTICVHMTNDLRSICVETSNPSTTEIYKYNGFYINFISTYEQYFDFMVCGKTEINNIDYDYMISKEDWNAFRR